MNRAVLIIPFAGLAAALAWRNAQADAELVEEGAGLDVGTWPQPEPIAPGGFFEQARDSIANGLQELIPVSYSTDDANVRAFLMMIRTAEGTADEGGYARLFGGDSFPSFADHPGITVTAGGYRSTAAGAYQILSRTWREAKAALDLPDFSPASQDQAAVWLIRRRGALADVKAGRFERAITKVNREWASLPGSPYGQPTISMARAKSILVAHGGTDTGSVIV